VPFTRDGQPQRAFLAVRTPDESRTLAVVADASAVAMVGADIAGEPVHARADATATLR
jgi:acetyl-CoA C-acetyltransferase